MANNANLPATGTVVATENISDVHYQYFIPAGTAGSAIGGTTAPFQVGGTIVVSAGTVQPLAGTVTVTAGSVVVTAGTVTPTQSTYIGGSTSACGSVAADIVKSATSNWAILAAEGAAAYFVINGTATSTSPGYIPQDGQTMIPVISNLGTIGVIGAGSATVVHVSFYKD